MCQVFLEVSQVVVKIETNIADFCTVTRYVSPDDHQKVTPLSVSA